VGGKAIGGAGGGRRGRTSKTRGGEWLGGIGGGVRTRAPEKLMRGKRETSSPHAIPAPDCVSGDWATINGAI